MRPPMELPAREVNPLGSVWTCNGFSADTALQFNAQRRVFLFGGMGEGTSRFLRLPPIGATRTKLSRKRWWHRGSFTAQLLLCLGPLNSSEEQHVPRRINTWEPHLMLKVLPLTGGRNEACLFEHPFGPSFCFLYIFVETEKAFILSSKWPWQKLALLRRSLEVVAVRWTHLMNIFFTPNSPLFILTCRTCLR